MRGDGSAPSVTTTATASSVAVGAPPQHGLYTAIVARAMCARLEAKHAERRVKRHVVSLLLCLVATSACERSSPEPHAEPHAMTHVEPNTRTSFSPDVRSPQLHQHDFVHPLAAVIGAVEIGDDVLVAPGASVRGDEGQPIFIGEGSNVQDGAVIHALETFDDGHVLEANLIRVGDRKYAVYVGKNVSITHQSQVHGPAAVGDNTFVGMQSLVFRAEVGENCVLEPRALVMGVKIAPGRYVPAGAVIRTQAEADALPVIDERYPFAHINEGVLHVNHALAESYGQPQHAPIRSEK